MPREVEYGNAFDDFSGMHDVFANYYSKSIIDANAIERGITFV